MNAAVEIYCTFGYFLMLASLENQCTKPVITHRRWQQAFFLPPWWFTPMNHQPQLSKGSWKNMATLENLEKQMFFHVWDIKSLKHKRSILSAWHYAQEMIWFSSKTKETHNLLVSSLSSSYWWQLLSNSPVLSLSTLARWLFTHIWRNHCCSRLVLLTEKHSGDATGRPAPSMPLMWRAA